MRGARAVHGLCITLLQVKLAANPAAQQKATMSFFAKLKAIFRPIPQPELPAHLPHGKQRIHLMSGDFPDADAAMTYCFHAPGDVPEQITLDQPGAFIDTSFVEVVFTGAATRLNEFLTAEEADRTIAKMRGANTLIIITEEAFGGFPYVLTHTPNLFYLGPYIVDV